MEISRINVYPVEGSKTIKANGNVSFNDEIVVKFTIIDSKNGLFVKFPSHSYIDADGKTQYVDDFYFLDVDIKDDVCDAILKVYADEAEQPKQRKTSRRSK